MSISFEKHRLNIISVWKDVLNDKTDINWSLFGYEGQTNELRVVGSGTGGLNELSEELNSGKIMYAFVRIEDNKTGLNKFVLINWQGEGAPVLRKGTCANHIHDVAKVLCGAHLTINARNEDDVDFDRILTKMSAVSSSYSFKEPRKIVEEPIASVGTNYTRIIPTKELNPSEMQNFWKKEEEEERQRIELEKQDKLERNQKLEREQRDREEKEHRKREENTISSKKLQSSHIPIKTSPQPLSPEKTSTQFSYNLTEAERMRQARNQEARELIGSRVLAAKAIFTKNTSESRLQSKLCTAPPSKPARNSIGQRVNAFNQNLDIEYKSAHYSTKVNEVNTSSVEINSINKQPGNYSTKVNEVNTSSVEINSINKQSGDVLGAFFEAPVTPEVTAVANNDDDILQMEDFPLEPENEQYSTIKRSPHSKSNSLQSPDDTSSSNTTDTAEVCTRISVTVQQPQSGLKNSVGKAAFPHLINEDDFICQDSLGGLGLRARALYDYQAVDETEITFDPGDIITHIDQIDEGWWQGLSPDGTYGLFPANYVEIID